ncbi:MAG TPA: protein phosphatase 2C domain-containing protein [Atribacteraceae bacterium]|nr:protein phosphatase 2C domain-containing protein [Atribacteraceae bacterium]
MRDRGFIVGDRVVSHAFETHPEWCAAYGKRGNYTVVGASVVGRLHLRDHRGREDSFLIRSRGEWLLIAAADGLGSARLGASGSSLAVSAYSEYFLGSLPSSPECPTEAKPKFTPLRRETAQPHEEAAEEYGCLFWFRESRKNTPATPVSSQQFDLETITRQSIEHARSIISGWADRSRATMSDFATTLISFLINSRTGLCFGLQLGDGAVVGVRDDESTLLVKPRLTGEVGETPVITQADWQDWVVTGTLSWEKEQLHAVLIMTDGVADDCLYGPPGNILNLFGQDITREIHRSAWPDRSARKLVRWLSTYRSRSSWDDRTMVIVFQ